MHLDAEAREERALWLRLILTPGIGPRAVRRLLEAFGLPEDILAGGAAKVAAVLGTPRSAALLGADEAREARIRETLEWARADEHHIVVLGDPEYPKRLLEIGDPPPVLYVRGRLDALARDSLAIVGSRHATQGGLRNAGDFARALADEGLQIVSGLAQGIDAAAHRGALEGRAGTLAIVGTGVDRVYPAQHRALAGSIAASGAIVSELPLGTTVQRSNFPRRNRLIAGIALGVLVVEAAPHSGSLITARQAGEFGREVMAIPGSIHSPVARGCHRLIREGAKLVESAEDVMVELRAMLSATKASAGAVRAQDPGGSDGDGSGCSGGPGRSESESGAGARPGGVAAALLGALGWDPTEPDALVERTGLTAGEVAAALLELELAGSVERCLDGRYARLP